MPMQTCPVQADVVPVNGSPARQIPLAIVPVQRGHNSPCDSAPNGFSFATRRRSRASQITTSASNGSLHGNAARNFPFDPGLRTTNVSAVSCPHLRHHNRSVCGRRGSGETIGMALVVFLRDVNVGGHRTHRVAVNGDPSTPIELFFASARCFRRDERRSGIPPSRTSTPSLGTSGKLPSV